MPVLVIDDPADPRLEFYRNVKDRDLTGRQGVFMAEGKVVLERLFTSPLCQTVSVLTTPSRLSGLNVPADVPVYVVDQAVMDQVAGFPIHRGYLAVGRYVPPPSLDSALPLKGRLRIMVLCGIANTDNMGGLMRNAAAFGVNAVVLDAACCDPLYRKAIRVSVGGALVVPHYRLSEDQSVLDVLNSYNLTAYALSPSGEVVLDQIVPSERSAFLLGAEGPGLDRSVIDAATSVQIPMHGGFDSLNVATTSGIVLYHLCKA